MKKLLHITISGFVLLCFNGCGWGWLVPYSFQPSFHKFKEICQLEPEIYQANGGKIDEEYYNKVLKYFNTSLDTIDWEYVQENLRLNRNGTYLYDFEKYYDRIYHSFTLFFNDNQARKDNIETILFYANWDKARPLPAGNEGTGLISGSVPITCIYFKKGLNNEKQRND